MSIYDKAMPWVRQRADAIRAGNHARGTLCTLTWKGPSRQLHGITDEEATALARVISEWVVDAGGDACFGEFAMKFLDNEFFVRADELRHIPERRKQAADKWQNWAEQMLMQADKELNNEHV